VGLIGRGEHAALRWFRANSFTPGWLPEKWRYLALGYLAGILTQALVLAADALLRQSLPPFLCEILLTLLAVVLLALTWGVGPGLLVTVIGATLAYYLRVSPLIPSPVFPQGVGVRSRWSDVLLLLVVGTLVSILMSQTQRMRRSAEQLATQLQATLAAMTDAVFVFDAAGHLLQTNGALQSVLGLEAPAHPATLHELHALLSPPGPCDERGQPLVSEQWPPARVLRGERLTGANAMDVLIRRPDGRESQLQIAGQPIFDAGGRIVGGVCVCRDVTDRRRLEHRTRDALRALLAMAETLVQAPEAAPLAEADREPPPSAEEPILLAGRSAIERVADLLVSALGCRRTGMFAVEPETDQLRLIASAGELPAENHTWWTTPPVDLFLSALAPAEAAARLRAGEVVVLDTVPPLHEEPRPSGGGRALAAPMRIREQVMGIMYLEDGADRPFEPDELALAAAGAQLGALVIERDQLLREREAAQASALALTEANRRMDEFQGIAAHELKTPLTSLAGNIQLMARRLSDARLQQAGPEDLGRIVTMARPLLGRAQYSLDRIGRLVDDLLDATRIHQGRLEFRLEPCDLATIVREAVEEQRHLAATRAIRLELPTAQPVPVFGDAGRIGQAVTNFLTNAEKYSPEDQPITVRLQVEGEVARVSVRDEGIGVPLAEQAPIWERFHRVEGVTIQSGSGIGMGIGLHVSRSIIEGHHGQVGVHSAPGQGSTFWFTLPLTRSAP
jgi:signal transduction histidine kinase/PAS domain-containing protein